MSEEELNPSYINARPEIIGLVPEGVESLLDVGCYTGEFSRALKSVRPSITVYGVELEARPARMAQHHVDEVVQADVENFNFDFGGHKFDCIVFGDVLEHLRWPEKVLTKSLEALAPGGTVVLSLPNIQHITAIKNLLLGEWPQRERGLFDRTHLRFFTWKSIVQLAATSGLRIEKVLPMYRFVDSPVGLNRYARIFRYTPFCRYFVYQYVVRLRLAET